MLFDDIFLPRICQTSCENLNEYWIEAYFVVIIRTILHTNFARLSFTIKIWIVFRILFCEILFRNVSTISITLFIYKRFEEYFPLFFHLKLCLYGDIHKMLVIYMDMGCSTHPTLALYYWIIQNLRKPHYRGMSSSKRKSISAVCLGRRLSWGQKRAYLKVSHHAACVDRAHCRKKGVQFTFCHILWQIIDN